MSGVGRAESERPELLRSAHPHFANYRSWQWIKHTVLSDYVVPWSRMLGSISRQIFVVDACAGAGAYVGPEGEIVRGSPLIAGQVAIEYQAKFPGRRMTVICVERDRGNFERLTAMMHRYRSVSILFRGDFADFHDQIRGILGSAPTLVLLDPFGLKDITADRCRPLLQRLPKTDVFVVVIMTVLHRVAGQLLRSGQPNPAIPGAAKNVENINAFFGTQAWIEIALRTDLNREQKENLYIDLYFDSVLGKRYGYKSAYEVRSRYQGPIKYWLVHASSHERAMWLMNDAIVKVDEMLMSKTYMDPGFLPGLGEASIDAYRAATFSDLQAAILAAIHDKGGPVTFDQLRRLLVPANFGKVREGVYAKAVKSLVRAENLRRQHRVAAKLEPSEKLGLP
jgi:three-Cys-motif partner protein